MIQIALLSLAFLSADIKIIQIPPYFIHFIDNNPILHFMLTQGLNKSRHTFYNWFVKDRKVGEL